MPERFKRDGRMWTFIPGKYGSTTSDPEPLEKGFNISVQKAKSKVIVNKKMTKSRENISRSLIAATRG